MNSVSGRHATRRRRYEYMTKGGGHTHIKKVQTGRSVKRFEIAEIV